MLIFGPVPSRRLGRSLGINHIPPKTCSYACVYCQLGRTSRMQITRQAFHSTASLVEAVKTQLTAAAEQGEEVDYLTFVPDGEPTLDENLGDTIGALRPLGIPTAVISNASLIWMAPVREALMQADWVSLKVDAVDEETWRRVDRPHGGLELAAILDDARTFARRYRGQLVTETMLVAGINDCENSLMATAKFIGDLQPSVAYLSVPTRPPAEPWVHPPDEATLARAYAIFSEQTPCTETLIGYEGNAFAFTSDAAADILSITAVHPMREDAMDAFLARAGAGRHLITQLVANKQLTESAYAGHTFFLRTFQRSNISTH